MKINEKFNSAPFEYVLGCIFEILDDYDVSEK